MAAVRDLGTYWRSGAVDVHYSDAGGGTAALVVCGELALAMVLDEHVANIPRVAPYEPGALFKRELPCIGAVLALNGPLDLLVVDGYATLDPGGRPGLGAYAADAFNLPVIGVGKTPFRASTHAIKVIRGTATRPLTAQPPVVSGSTRPPTSSLGWLGRTACPPHWQGPTASPAAERNQSPPEAPAKPPRSSLRCTARAQCADNAARIRLTRSSA